MPVEVIMPKVDMDMESGKLATWHVAEGEAVKKGAPLFDIETDKAAMEVESPASGRLFHIIAAPGQTVNVGSPVAWIYAENEEVGKAPSAAPAKAPEAPVADRPAAAPAPVPEPAVELGAVVAESETPAAPAGSDGAVRATPAARRLARGNGLDLTAIAGSGPRGRIQRDDVEKAVGLSVAARPAEARAPSPEPARLETAGPAMPLVEEGTELFVSRRKGSGTPLLMLHGFTADSMGWMPLERELPGELALTRIDLPGHGKSPRLQVNGFAELVRLVVSAFDRAVDGRVHILAHSLGGAVALALADVRPRQIASLTLIAPAGLGPEIDHDALSGIARASRTESLAPWLKRLTARPDGISWDFARAAMLARNDPALRSVQVELAGTLFPDGVQSFDLTAALERVVAPTSIIWGRSDHIVPWRHALAAGGEMALHLLHGIGHIPHVECPGVVAGILARTMCQEKPR